MEKNLKVVVWGVNIFAVTVLIDFVITLFNIVESGRYVGFTGLVINQEMTNDYMTSEFSVEPKIILFLIGSIFLSFFINKLLEKKNIENY